MLAVGLSEESVRPKEKQKSKSNDKEKENEGMPFILENDKQCLLEFQRHDINAIQRLLGRGTYGDVFLVRDANQKVYALKVMRPSSAYQREVVQNEIAVLSFLRACKANHVPQFYGSWECPCFSFLPWPSSRNSTCYFVLMEAFDINASEYFSNTYRPTRGMLAHLFVMVMELGALGIVHGDLKLAQFLFRLSADKKEATEAVLTDFGFSSLMVADDYKKKPASTGWCRQIWKFDYFALPECHHKDLVIKKIWAIYLNVIQLISDLLYEECVFVLPEPGDSRFGMITGFSFTKEDEAIFAACCDPVQYSMMHRYIGAMHRKLEDKYSPYQHTNKTGGGGSVQALIMDLSLLLPPFFQEYRDNRRLKRRQDL